MENILEDLWNAYLEEKDPISSEEEIRLLVITEKAEQALRNALNKEQTALLDEYMSCREELDSIHAFNSFKVGVQFATKYLLEALKADER